MSWGIGITEGGRGQLRVYQTVELARADAEVVDFFRDVDDLARSYSPAELLVMLVYLGDDRDAREMREFAAEHPHPRYQARVYPRGLLERVFAAMSAAAQEGRRVMSKAGAAAATKEREPAKEKAPRTPREPRAPKPKARDIRGASIITMGMNPKTSQKWGGDQNPKRPGSAAHSRFGLYKDGMTVQQFLDAGGWAADLNWDEKQGFIYINPPGSPTGPKAV